MRTLLYLIRHAATPANLAVPSRLQGRNSDPSLAPVGVCQAEATRDFLADLPIGAFYSSPLVRAMQTACIIAEPHGKMPTPLMELIECDVGRWEGLDWETIREAEPDAYRTYMDDPATVPYPDGESFGQVHDRAAPEFDRLLELHAGHSIAVVSHHVVNRTYLAGLLGLPIQQARKVSLENCGISVVQRAGGKTTVLTLNAAFHLQRLAG